MWQQYRSDAFTVHIRILAASVATHFSMYILARIALHASSVECQCYELVSVVLRNGIVYIERRFSLKIHRQSTSHTVATLNTKVHDP
jgi:hypothetical protein